MVSRRPPLLLVAAALSAAALPGGVYGCDTFRSLDDVTIADAGPALDAATPVADMGPLDMGHRPDLPRPVDGGAEEMGADMAPPPLLSCEGLEFEPVEVSPPLGVEVAVISPPEDLRLGALALAADIGEATRSTDALAAVEIERDEEDTPLLFRFDLTGAPSVISCHRLKAPKGHLILTELYSIGLRNIGESQVAAGLLGRRSRECDQRATSDFLHTGLIPRAPGEGPVELMHSASDQELPCDPDHVPLSELALTGGHSFFDNLAPPIIYGFAEQGHVTPSDPNSEVVSRLIAFDQSLSRLILSPPLGDLTNNLLPGSIQASGTSGDYMLFHEPGSERTGFVWYVGEELFTRRQGAEPYRLDLVFAEHAELVQTGATVDGRTPLLLLRGGDLQSDNSVLNTDQVDCEINPDHIPPRTDCSVSGTKSDRASEGLQIVALAAAPRPGGGAVAVTVVEPQDRAAAQQTLRVWLLDEEGVFQTWPQTGAFFFEIDLRLDAPLQVDRLEIDTLPGTNNNSTMVVFALTGTLLVDGVNGAAKPILAAGRFEVSEPAF